ncbi:MAG: pilus (MSHA type) biogenesis protein MshL [Pseudomonadales bacterium]|nr:pilus (MSHA type) biogenesis protein MshL [Pseudomonadales bacterium]MBO6564953.1 pilus (MSHA type) biogenesis protein MshL [Pseudomonadales bacterium]MBO6597088.1 pilus (MSHA type) biogenesis protein MshL [Pseudomonadales bacterium]MBO6823725.1 pilus (MSHA type) biogenesis protein MshL [Pseudomonadales bacterium]
MNRISIQFLLLILVTGCSLSGVEDPPMSMGHLQPVLEASSPMGSDATSDIPATVRAAPVLPPPETSMEEPTHTVVVYDVPLSELLFSLARDSGMNLDIDSQIGETVTINAVEQTLPALLDRISRNADIRYSIIGNTLRVERDVPYIRNYRVDYLNMSRISTGSVAVATQISSTGTGGSASSTSGNSSDTLVESSTVHAFWDSLRGNIESIIADSSGPDVVEGATTVNPNIIINRESGVLAVRATARQHKEVNEFLSNVQNSAQRQVLIEATIAEVNLNDRYQAGIDWQLVNPDDATGVDGVQQLTDIALSSRPTFNITIDDQDFGGNQLQTTLAALETFGDVTVMSSPKVMAMNNQTALLKVVDNLIYFTIDVNIDTSGGGVDGGTLTTFETEVNTVPVGFVMSVTPYIDEADQVILNVRPTISRVIDFVRDPNPALAETDVVSEIPVIQVREVESILSVGSGDIAVIGGLMQDEVTKSQRGLPVLQSVPGVGRVFRYEDNETKKTELVIFLKPTVIRNASLDGDLKHLNTYLPSAESGVP